MSHLSERAQFIADMVGYILSLGVFSIMVWQTAESIRYSIAHNVHTTLLKIPESVSLVFFGLSYVLFLLAVISLMIIRITERIQK